MKLLREGTALGETEAYLALCAYYYFIIIMNGCGCEQSTGTVLSRTVPGFPHIWRKGFDRRVTDNHLAVMARQ